MLCYMVFVCALIRPKIRYKILAPCSFIQFRLEKQGTKLCWQTYNTQSLTIPVAFVLNQLIIFIRKKISLQNMKENNRSATEV